MFSRMVYEHKRRRGFHNVLFVQLEIHKRIQAQFYFINIFRNNCNPNKIFNGLTATENIC